MNAPLPASPAGIAHVGVIGGGTAGYFAALAFQARFPHLQVTIVESSLVPIIGVGEATTTLMPPFLHKVLGIDVVDFYQRVRPTWKMGIEFDWGPAGGFDYPFGDYFPIEAVAYDGKLGHHSFGARAMRERKSPLVRDAQGQIVSLLHRQKYAYHLDNARFVGYLTALARERGIGHIDAHIDDVAVTPDGESVAFLKLRDGRELRFDLYVDASGFRSVLAGGALQTPFQSFASSLFCDTAVVGALPHDGTICPYTLAQMMDCGWCWKIPVEEEDHRGYVFSSAFMTEDEAKAEMRAKNPGLGDTWTVRFKSGRYRDYWRGNTIAVGNAYGFVEPLESTALHMVILELSYVLDALAKAPAGEQPDRAACNDAVGRHWDFLRWFLSIHYKFNQRLDNAFWRACRADVDVSGFAGILERYRTQGPWLTDGNGVASEGDPTFGYHGIMVMLLGQEVAGAPAAQLVTDPAGWAAHRAQVETLVARAVPQREALNYLHSHPDVLRAAIADPSSWVSTGSEVRRLLPEIATERPRDASGPYDAVLDGVWFAQGRGSSNNAAASRRAAQ